MQGRQEVARNSRAGDEAIGSEGPKCGGGAGDSKAGGRRGLWLRGRPGRAVMGHGQVGAKVERTR